MMLMRGITPHFVNILFLARSARAISSVVLVSLIGCSLLHKSSLRDELAGQGIIELSRDNPYVASNLLLSREMTHSPTLRGFIELRGTPDALEIEQWPLQETSLRLYYLDRGERYLMRRLDADWVIRPPTSIPRGVLAQLPGDGAHSIRRPPLLSEESTGIPLPEKSEEPEEPKEIAEPRYSLENADRVQVDEPSPSVIHETLSGDMIHVVSMAGETLRIITLWYTGDVLNVKRVARINDIQKPDRLELGSRIRIPRYLLETTTPLPSSVVQRYRQSGSLPRNIPKGR